MPASAPADPSAARGSRQSAPLRSRPSLQQMPPVSASSDPPPVPSAQKQDRNPRPPQQHVSSQTIAAILHRQLRSQSPCPPPILLPSVLTLLQAQTLQPEWLPTFCVSRLLTRWF